MARFFNAEEIIKDIKEEGFVFQQIIFSQNKVRVWAKYDIFKRKAEFVTEILSGEGYIETFDSLEEAMDLAEARQRT